MTLFIVSSSMVGVLQNANAQEFTGLSAMTLVSFGNTTSSTASSSQPIENTTVTYFGNSSGYLVYPALNQSGDVQGKLPAVVVIHENRGLNDYIKESANILAQKGYVALAVDLFNGEIAGDQNRARELTTAIRENPDVAIQNMKAAVAYLASLDNVDASRIASLGWCFGGQQSLELALNSRDNPLAATVIYYGRVTNDTQALSNIGWPVLGIFGGKDQSIPVETVKAFQNALNQTGITNEVYIYPNVGHAFANPSNDNYAQSETADAWKKTLDFLDRHLKA
ncbi:MAG: dienelactone hydrolase family protein [Thermoproteota archaeon]|nr:dienelactone hydrolase family protein [Thermoproteota archaeon]